MNNDETIGIIYPVMKRNFDFLKKRNTPVYVKYITNPESKNATRLKNGHFLLFYLSRKDKTILGYSTIKNISFKKPYEIKESYLDQIQMEEKEFENYTSDRQSKSLIFLELNKITALENPVQLENPITMAGKYVSINEIKRLLGDDIID